MSYLKNIADKIKQGLSKEQTTQQILCALVLWQWSDIEQALQQVKKPLTIEQFLCAYIKIDEHALRKHLHALAQYRDQIGADVLQECLCKRIE